MIHTVITSVWRFERFETVIHKAHFSVKTLFYYKIHLSVDSYIKLVYKYDFQKIIDVLLLLLFLNYTAFWDIIFVGLNEVCAVWRSVASMNTSTHLQPNVFLTCRRKYRWFPWRSHTVFAVAVEHFSQSINQNSCANEWKILTIQFGEEIADVWKR